MKANSPPPPTPHIFQLCFLSACFARRHLNAMQSLFNLKGNQQLILCLLQLSHTSSHHTPHLGFISGFPRFTSHAFLSPPPHHCSSSRPKPRAVVPLDLTRHHPPHCFGSLLTPLLCVLLLPHKTSFSVCVRSSCAPMNTS